MLAWRASMYMHSNNGAMQYIYVFSRMTGSFVNGGILSRVHNRTSGVKS